MALSVSTTRSYVPSVQSGMLNARSALNLPSTLKSRSRLTAMTLTIRSPAGSLSRPPIVPSAPAPCVLNATDWT